MRKLLVALIVLILLVGGAGAFAYGYVSPSEKLDLAYEEVPLENRALEMARRLSTEMELTEADVDNLGKKQLAADPAFESGFLVTGARFRLENGLLIADVNAKWRDRVPVGLRLAYRLEWQSPNLIARIDSAKLKDVDLPADALDDVVIPIGDQLPKFIHVQNVRIENDRVVVQFRKPSLQDLQGLLG